jgi:ArsR family transcriptional regulator, lead/cadmium/zinc/bismuth-responsive transcriptional repressor
MFYLSWLMKKEGKITLRRCTPGPGLHDQPIFSHDQAATMEGIFKMLANSTRLRILHALIRAPGIAVGTLADAIGMKPQAVSNQLRRLMDKGIVVARREGNYIRYRIVDDCTINLLNQGFCLAFHGTHTETIFSTDDNGDIKPLNERKDHQWKRRKK